MGDYDKNGMTAQDHYYARLEEAHRKAVLRQQAHMHYPAVAAFLTLVGLVALAVFIRWLING